MLLVSSSVFGGEISIDDLTNMVVRRIEAQKQVEAQERSDAWFDYMEDYLNRADTDLEIFNNNGYIGYRAKPKNNEEGKKWYVYVL